MIRTDNSKVIERLEKALAVCREYIEEIDRVQPDLFNWLEDNGLTELWEKCHPEAEQ